MRTAASSTTRPMPAGHRLVRARRGQSRAPRCRRQRSTPAPSRNARLRRESSSRRCARRSRRPAAARARAGARARCGTSPSPGRWCRAASRGHRAPGTSTDRCSRPVKRGEPFGRDCRVDAERLQLLLDDGRRSAVRRPRTDARRVDRGTDDSPAAAGRAHELLLGHDELTLQDAVAQRADEAERRADDRAPMSIENVSPTATCNTYCSDVASPTTGTAPSSNVRRSSSQGFARSASDSAIDAANVKRPASMNPGSGAMIVGFVGRYRFRQLASSPGRTRKRVKRICASCGAWSISASRPLRRSDCAAAAISDSANST